MKEVIKMQKIVYTLGSILERNKLIRGVYWNVVGTVLSKCFIIFVGVITARILGADKNGEYGIIYSTITMIATFAGLGLGMTATRFIAEFKVSSPLRCGRVIALTNLLSVISSLLAGMLLIKFSPVICTQMLNSPHLENSLKISALYFFTLVINTIQISTLSGFEEFKINSRLSIVQGILSIPVLTLGALKGNVDGLLWANVAVGIIMAVLYMAANTYVRKKANICIVWKGALKEWELLYKFALPALLSNIVVVPVTWIGNALITQTMNGYTALGIFNAANQWRAVLVFIPTAVGNVMLPYLVSEKRTQRVERFNSLIGWYIVVSISALLMLSPRFFVLLYGRSYQGASFEISMMIIILTACVLSYTDGISRNIVSSCRMWVGFLNNAIWGIVFLTALTCFNLKSHGSIGLAASYLIAYVMATAIMLPVYERLKIIHFRYMISREVILIWLFLLGEITVNVRQNYAILKILFCICIYCLLYKIGRNFIENS